MNATEIYNRCLNGWGDKKELFGVSHDEMEILLLDAETVIIEVNRNNNDGTFYTEVQYCSKKFATSNVEKVKNGP